MRFLICISSCILFSLQALSQAKVKLADLKEHIGDSVVVEGAVKAIQYSENTKQSSTFITVGNLNNSLIVVITRTVRKKFTVKPEVAYKDKSIRVSGWLVNRNNKPQIVIKDPSQIVLIDDK